jgi:hypothetical protein
VDLRSRGAFRYGVHEPAQSKTLTEAQMLDGGNVLLGFKLPLRDLFAELDVQGDD